jgi:hypothetical protein
MIPKSPEGRLPSEASRIRKIEKAFKKRGGRTIVTEPLTEEERAFVHRGYGKKEETQEAPVPALQERIADKIRLAKKHALKALNPEEKCELYSYLDAVWFRHPNLGKIINPLMSLVLPGEEIPETLSEREYQDLMKVIEDPARVAREEEAKG